MATIPLLDPYEPAIEPQDDAEPRVFTADVAAVLRRVVRPDDDDAGQSVALIAERAETSTRTVYRIISCSTTTLRLALADRLCMAAESHLSACRLLWPDGRISAYDGSSV